MFGALKNLLGGEAESAKTEYWVGDIGLTLMVYNNQLETHVQSDIRRYDYFFKAPPGVRGAASATEFQQRLLSVMHAVYQEHGRAFKLREPDDINYIAIVQSAFRELTAQEVASKPWLTARPPHWEQSHCLLLSASGFEKTNTDAF
jgi:hypothetical protein